MLAFSRSGSGKTLSISCLIEDAVGRLFALGPKSVQYSLVEVYGDKLYDLIQPLESPKKGGKRPEPAPVAFGKHKMATLESVGSLPTLKQHIKGRRVASTPNNSASSRSHMVLTFEVGVGHPFRRRRIVGGPEFGLDRFPAPAHNS